MDYEGNSVSSKIVSFIKSMFTTACTHCRRGGLSRITDDCADFSRNKIPLLRVLSMGLLLRSDALNQDANNSLALRHPVDQILGPGC